MVGVFSAYDISNTFIIGILILINTILFIYHLIINALYKTLKAYKFKGVTGLLVFLFSFCFGALICVLNKDTLKKNHFGNRNYEYLKVWIINEPEQTNDILRFEVKVTRAYENSKPNVTIGKLLIALKIDSLKPIQLSYGDELLITTKYLAVEPAYNPAEFDFKAWLAAKNIYHQTFVNQNQVIKIGTARGNVMINYAINVRKKQVATYRKYIKNDEAFAVASTLVLGYRADLNHETLSAYSKTGTIHALSVSGMHVGIIYILLDYVLFFLNRNKVLKFLKLALICTLIWYYALLTGFSASVLRSAIMLTIFILAKYYSRASNNYNILAFTALCLLFYNPFLIWDVGFQLSFLAVFGLIYLQPKIYKCLYVKNKWLDKLWSTIALCFAAQIATFPLSIYYFHQFPLYFIFANLFIVLPLTAMMYIGIAILMLKAYFLTPIFEWIIIFTNTGLKWIAALPFSGITAIYLNKWQLILLSCSLVLFIYAVVNFKKLILMVSIILLILFQSYALYQGIQTLKQKKIIFFSLKKNYAAAFIDSKNAILLTDLTKEDKNYQYFIQPALAQLQVNKIQHIKWEESIKKTNFIKNNNQLIFYNYHAILIDEKFNDKELKDLPQFNAVWLHRNPKQQIAKLRSTVIFNTLIVDATNFDEKIEKFKNEANKIKLQHHVLKKNNSYLIDLNVVR